VHDLVTFLQLFPALTMSRSKMRLNVTQKQKAFDNTFIMLMFEEADSLFLF